MNLRLFLLFFLSLLLITHRVAGREKTIPLTLSIRQATPQPVSLSFLVGGLETETQKSEIDKSGRYHFNLRYRPGFYRLTMGEREWSLTFPLFTPQSEIQELTISTSGIAPLEEVVATGAPELPLYFDARRAREAYQEALWGLEALRRGGVPELQLQTIGDTNEQIYRQRIEAVTLRADSLQSPTICQIMRLFTRPQDTLTAHWWDAALLTTAWVATAPEFDSYVRAYLQTRYSDSLSYWGQVQNYSQAIRSVAKIESEAVNALMLRHALEFIVQGGVYDVLLDSIARYYPNSRESALYRKDNERKTERLVKLRGTRLDDRRTFIVSKDADYTLLIVWSVWCAHCQELLPELARVCENLPQKQVAVRAICIDKVTPEVRNFIGSRVWPWENILEPDDGESDILTYLQADGTPELFLLDKKGRLISRPEDAKRLERELLWLQIATCLQGKLY